MNTYLMNAGRNVLISRAQGTGPSGVISSFEIGSAVGFPPNYNQSYALPNPPVYTGTTSAIRKTIVTNDEVIITVFLDYSLTFPIGNVMLKLDTGAPLFWMIFDQLFKKVTKNEITHYAGDIYFIPFVIRYPSIGNKLDLSNLQDFYANAPAATDLLAMKDVWSNECDQQELNNSTYTFNKGRPIYETKIKNKWWGTPFAMDLTDSRKWIIDGGNAGDEYVYSKQ